MWCMDDRKAKEWILKSIEKKYKVSKDQIVRAHTKQTLVALASRERRAMTESFKVPSKFNTKNKKIQTVHMKSSQRARLPPGEDKVRRLVNEMAGEGKIELVEKGINQFGTWSWLVPVDPDTKLDKYGHEIIQFFLLKEHLYEILDKSDDEIKLEDLCKYVTVKNSIYRFPVEFGHSSTHGSVFAEDVSDYVLQVIAVRCSEFEKDLGDAKTHALKNLSLLVDNDKYIREPLRLVHRSHPDRGLDIKKFVNPILDYFPEA